MKILFSQLRWLKHVSGPWTIEPFYLGFLTFFMVASLYSIHENSSPTYFNSGVILRPAVSTAIALLTLLQLRIMIRLIPSYTRRFSTYLFILSIQAFTIWSWVILMRSIFPDLHSGTMALLSPIPLIRFLFTFLTVNAFIGLSRERLMNALSEKEEMLKIVDQQGRLLLNHDESTRSEISAFLHDRVQSSLVTACLELQEISMLATDEIKVEINRVIHALENLRSNEVRSASQTLSPAVGNEDLATSIKLMGEIYAPNMIVNVNIASDIEDLPQPMHRELFLGIYRIVEQSFLNAHIHGRAREFEVRIARIANSVHLITRNDGTPLVGDFKNGLGTAIINSWVRTLNGSWELGSNADSEAELRVVLPL